MRTRSLVSLTEEMTSVGFGFSSSQHPDVLLSFKTFNGCHTSPCVFACRRIIFYVCRGNHKRFQSAHIPDRGQTLMQTARARACARTYHFIHSLISREGGVRDDLKASWRADENWAHLIYSPTITRESLFQLRATKSSRACISHCMTSRNQSKPAVIKMTDAGVVCN